MLTLYMTMHEPVNTAVRESLEAGSRAASEEESSEESGVRGVRVQGVLPASMCTEHALAENPTNMNSVSAGNHCGVPTYGGS